MRALFLVSLCMLLFTAAWAQKSCCSTTAAGKDKAAAMHCAQAKPATASATAQFASLANDASFRATHDEPLPYVHQTKAGQEISFPTPDGQTARAFAYLSPKKTEKWLLVFHEWWGLNDHIKREAGRYFQELGGVNVLALDLYDGKVATSREEAQQYMQAVAEARATAIIEGALQYAGEDAEIGTLGWCFGGGWSLQAAIIAGDKAEACVMYYGMPEQEVSQLRKLDCDVLGIFAKQDGWITPQVVETFELNMAKADKELEVKMFDAQHGFANPSNPDFNKKAAESAYRSSLVFLKEHLKEK